MREADKIDHLLRRTGFGATPSERKRAHRLGYEKTVREILQKTNDYQPAEAPPSTPLPPIVLPATLLNFGQGVLWWLRTLTNSTSPLNERLTLFWHRHFATSGSKVFNPGWMFEQNQTFRRSQPSKADACLFTIHYLFSSSLVFISGYVPDPLV